MTEYQVTALLSRLEPGLTEVECQYKGIYGKADLVTDTELIEVKHCRYWEKGVKQVVKYHRFFPHLNKRLHLFGSGLSKYDKETLLMVCKTLNIRVTWHQSLLQSVR